MDFSQTDILIFIMSIFLGLLFGVDLCCLLCIVIFISSSSETILLFFIGTFIGMTINRIILYNRSHFDNLKQHNDMNNNIIIKDSNYQRGSNYFDILGYN